MITKFGVPDAFWMGRFLWGIAQNFRVIVYKDSYYYCL